MLCGYCSREQNFRPEDCGICHAVLVGKKGGRFWEGGQGESVREEECVGWDVADGGSRYKGCY